MSTEEFEAETIDGMPAGATADATGTPTPTELFNSLTGEQIDITDADALADAYELCLDELKRLAMQKASLVVAIAALAPHDDERKTVRVRGARRVLKIEAPADTWDQARLKQVWFSYPSFRDEFLKISTIAAQAVPLKKAMATAGPRDFETFLKMVCDANRGPRGLPRVSLET